MPLRIMQNWPETGIATKCCTMSWETRGNNRYYYRKTRKNGRVVSEYLGAGPFVEAIVALEQLDRERERMARQAERETLEADLELDRQVDRVTAAVRDVTRAALVASGYHTHKGQWRKAKG